MSRSEEDIVSAPRRLWAKLGMPDLWTCMTGGNMYPGIRIGMIVIL